MPVELQGKVKVANFGTKNPSVGMIVLEIEPGYTVWASHNVKMPDGTLVKKRLYPSRKTNTLNLFVAKARPMPTTNTGARVFRTYNRSQ